MHHMMMADESVLSKKKGYWYNELASLGIHHHEPGESDGRDPADDNGDSARGREGDVKDLVERVKQDLLQEYRAAYYYVAADHDGK